MYVLSSDKKTLESESTIARFDFSDLDMTENNLEEILANNIGILDDDEGEDAEEGNSLLVIGRQVRNEMRVMVEVI